MLEAICFRTHWHMLWKFHSELFCHFHEELTQQSGPDLRGGKGGRCPGPPDWGGLPIIPKHYTYLVLRNHIKCTYPWLVVIGFLKVSRLFHYPNLNLRTNQNPNFHNLWCTGNILEWIYSFCAIFSSVWGNIVKSFNMQNNLTLSSEIKKKQLNNGIVQYWSVFPSMTISRN